MMTQGKKFRKAVASTKPLQVVGTINAYTAMLAERVGHQALYLSGAGVANASYGLPDLGMTSLENVLEDVRRITGASSLPLLVDADTGWDSTSGIAHTVREMTQAGAAGLHLEDQVAAKRCGHRPNKALVSQQEMVDRIKAAVDARPDPTFVIMARTDGFAGEGLERALDRACAYVEAGADMLFPEALTALDSYRSFADAVDRPILANMTEFGKTELFTTEQLAGVGVGLVLYPLSAFRAMNAAALKVYQTIKKDGTQRAVVDTMQTRSELYDMLNYHGYEQRLDEQLDKEKNHG